MIPGLQSPPHNRRPGHASCPTINLCILFGIYVGIPVDSKGPAQREIVKVHSWLGRS